MIKSSNLSALALGALALTAPSLGYAQDALPPEASEHTVFIFNTLLFLIGGFLVFFMACGFAMLEAGLVRSKNVAMQCTKNVALFSLASLAYLLVGFNMMYPGDAWMFEGWGGALKSFQARLAWRDHFMQKLEDEPALEFRCLHSAYQGLRSDDRALREAWQKGETGLPFVDACMRFLDHTGWLNFRMRSMVMAVASYHLWLDWRATGLHLARQFTDYEPGIHWSQTQMQSGTTGMNTVRIYNPIKQGRDQDPDGVFTRRWVPELKDVPLKYLQEPWRWEQAASLRYPPPIVDVTEAARAARQAIWAVRKGGAFREEAARVVEKHASRKDPQRHFVNDRETRKRRAKTDDRQKGFDF